MTEHTQIKLLLLQHTFTSNIQICRAASHRVGSKCREGYDRSHSRALSNNACVVYCYMNSLLLYIFRPTDPLHCLHKEDYRFMS